MKPSVERRADRVTAALQDNPDASKQSLPFEAAPTRLFFVAMIFVAMIAAIVFLDAALSLRDLWFHDALITQMGGWPVLPAMLIFPQRPLLPHLPFQYATPVPGYLDGWFAILMLFVAFLGVFAVYLLALRRLPGSISWRFIWRSTLLIGCLYLLIPVVTSPDLFSYIAYARMGVFHNLNPLTTIPTAIKSDPVYGYVFWVDQPSAYGPTWAVVTSVMQWLLAVFRNGYIMPMVIALRVTGLVMHLASTWLIWLISGQWQQLAGQPALATRKRIRATLAFAWNPLLLIEACVNAHNDAMLLVFVLLMVWLLSKEKIGKMQVEGQSNGVAAIVQSAEISVQTAEKTVQNAERPGRGQAPHQPGRGQAPHQPGRGQAPHQPGRGQAPPVPYTGKNGAQFRSRVGAGLALALGFVSVGLAPALEVVRTLKVALAPKFVFLMRPFKKGMERIPVDLRTPIAAACLLALGTCLKINIVLFVPGLLCYIWMQAPAGRRLKQAGATLISYVGVIVLFYAPFWQGGAIFDVFRVNPATYRTINTLAAFLAHAYNSIAGLFGNLSGTPVDSPAERFMHTFSTGIFVLLFLVMLWRAVRAPWHLQSPRGLVYWMAVTWILYCAIGSPWFWPWYLVTFFGLYALLEATDEETPAGNKREIFPWRLWFMRSPWTVRLLSASMLTLYCLITGPARTFVHGLPGFQWSDTSGAWGWILPVLGSALLLRFWPRKKAIQ